MTDKDLLLIQRYLTTTSNRLRLVDEKLDTAILQRQDNLNPTGKLENLQGESNYLDLIDSQVRAIKASTEVILWKVASLNEKK